jgi:hypothetical protein
MIIAPDSNAQSNARFVDNGDGTVTDTASGLMWIKSTPSPLFKHAVTWFEAKKECENMEYAGYNDWRLPTIKEWKTIIDTKYQFPALIEPNPFQNVIVKFAYWSSSEYDHGMNYECDSNGCAPRSYIVQLYFGSINNQRKDVRAFVWPVRSIKKMDKRTVMNNEAK